MLRRVITIGTYNGNARDIFLAALDLRTMSDAMTGLAVYDGIPDAPVKEGDTVTVDVTTLKLYKTKNYDIFIEQVDEEACVMQSREKGGAIQRWDHRLSIRQEGEMAIWTDDVIMDAGLMTPFVARFGAYMYRRRHKYRQALSVSSKISVAK